MSYMPLIDLCKDNPLSVTPEIIRKFKDKIGVQR